MSDFTDKEQSKAESAPIECYKFVGSFKTYRYTSAADALLLGGELYLPVPVKRNTAKAGTQDDDNLSLELVFPFDADIVFDYAYALSPPTLLLEAYRTQADLDTNTQFELFWKGKVRGFKVSGRQATIIVPSIFALALQGEVPNFYYQAPCNHVLYDDGCKVIRDNNKFTGEVDSINGREITLLAAPTSTNDLAAGEIVNTRNGERRLILSNVGSIVTVGFPFADLLAGDPVEMVRGCDHSFNGAGGCPKFANQLNFGGFPFIPADNPFEGEL